MHSGEVKDHEVFAQDDSEGLGMTAFRRFRTDLPCETPNH